MARDPSVPSAWSCPCSVTRNCCAALPDETVIKQAIPTSAGSACVTGTASDPGAGIANLVPEVWPVALPATPQTYDIVVAPSGATASVLRTQTVPPRAAG